LALNCVIVVVDKSYLTYFKSYFVVTYTNIYVSVCNHWYQ